AQAQAAVATGALGEAAAAVDQAGGELAALVRLSPGVAALRRSEDATEAGPHAAELAELARLVGSCRAAVQATVRSLRHRQAETVAELEAMAGMAGPYAASPAGSLLLDRSG